MLEFQTLTPESAAVITPYFRAAASGACDHTFGACYQWRGYDNNTWCVRDETLFMWGNYYPPFGSAYLMPAGPGDPDRALDTVEADACEKGLPLKLWVPGDAALETVCAHFGSRVLSAEPVRDLFDYIYDIESLKTFAGKKMHGQKNHLNRFLRENPGAEFVPVTPRTLPEAEAFLSDYARETAFTDAQKIFELKHARELIHLYDVTGLTAGFIRTESGVVAISAGEVIGNTLFVHIEKACTSVSGAYQAMVSMFANYAAGEDVLWCNREDDAGDEGLRTSKLSYQPVSMLKKYAVTISGGTNE